MMENPQKVAPEASEKPAHLVLVDGQQLHEHLGELVRGSVEQTLNALLDAEADALCGADR